MRILLATVCLWSLLLAAPVGAQPDDTSPPQLVDGRFDQAWNALPGGYLAPADPAFHQWPLTVELWARSVEGPDERVLVANGLRTSGSYWELRMEGARGQLVAHLAGFAPSTIKTESYLADGDWHYLAMTLSADSLRLYVDGNLVRQTDLRETGQPAQVGALGIGTRLDEKKPSAVWIDDVRISNGERDILALPDQALIKDRYTVGLWSFDESEEEYLARWTPGGETNQRQLPYPHRIAEYEFAEDPQWVDGRWQETDKGPLLTHTTQIPGYEVGVKNLVIFLGYDRRAAVMFDLERCAAVAGVTAAALQIDPARFGLLRKPALHGQMQFYLPPTKAWRQQSGRRAALQPIAKESLNYRGLYLHGNQVLLSYEVLGASVLDLSQLEEHRGLSAISRHLQWPAAPKDAVLTLAEMPADDVKLERIGNTYVASCRHDDQVHAIALLPNVKAASLVVQDRDVQLRVDEEGPWGGAWYCWSGSPSQWKTFLELVGHAPQLAQLCDLRQPGGLRWGEPLLTRGKLGDGQSAAPYVIDTITLPTDNPHKALFFVSGFDFFSNGDAALCTAHGDVWLVRGLDEQLEQVTWQRYATGLYQPLGLKIVDDCVIVLGRDQLTRLHDENGDGEADYYEAFNNDLQITGRDHAFAMRLETDSKGNFYFVKSGEGPHGSALLKVSPDGRELSVVARGFRHPYGLGVGPQDEITVADNEGNYVPSSKIDFVQPGGFYGFVNAGTEADPGLQPMRPLCYLPKVADNSSGGQVWVTSNQWGDYHRGEMLHLSWGRCTLHAVLRQNVGGIWQAATVQFPDLTFLAGPGEGAFHPHDGQLYVVGLNGWQTGAVADGCFQRVRYTGGPIYMPADFEVVRQGLHIRFTQPLDRVSAETLSNYRIEQWNYKWASTYGSFHYLASDSEQIGHDTLPIASARLGSDGRSVFLEVPGLQPVDQLQLSTDIEAADGQPLRFNVYSTINAVH